MKTLRSLIPIALAILAVPLAPVATAGPLDIWTWRNPLPTGNQLNAITYGKGLFVAVGANSTIVTSSDGINWEQQVAPPNCSLSGVAYSPDPTLFVAVGADAATGTTNVILTSSDGINWFPFTGWVGTSGFLAVATDGARNFVAVGTLGVVWYSLDGGSSWQAGATPSGAQNLNAVAYGNSMFVAVDDSGQIFTSTTGSSWTQQFIGGTSAALNGITYQPGKGFVVVGNGTFLFSTNGVNWSITTESYFGNGVVYANGNFVAVNTDTYYPEILTSSDGKAWAGFTVYELFNAIAYDGSSTFVSVGPNSTIANSTTGTNNWNVINSSVTTGSLKAVVFGTTYAGTPLFVAGGAGNFQAPAILTSMDGFNWQLDTDPSIDNEVKFYDSFINGLAFGKNSTGVNYFVATVNTTPGYLYSWDSVIISSSNAVVWTTNYISNYLLNGITYGKNAAGTPLFVAVGNQGWVVWSSNLTVLPAWNFSPSAFLEAAGASLNAATYGSTLSGTPLFVAVGSAGTILISADGMTWNPATSASLPPSSDTFNGVTFGNKLFVAVGSGGVIFTSSDGNSWYAQTSGTTANLNAVSFANGLFAAVTGNNGSGAAILVSTNGVNWTPSSFVAPNSLNAVAFGYTFGNNQFIAVGGEGAILGSVLSAILPGQYGTNGFTVTVSGPPGYYAVYVSYNLTSWTAQLPYILLTSQNPSTNWNDPNAVIHSGGYYYVGPAP